MSALTNETKLRIEKTIKNLKANKMDAYYCKNKTDACNLVKTLIKKGDVISSGGSVTLKQTGVYDIITSSDYNYLDRLMVSRLQQRTLYSATRCILIRL